MLFKFIPRQPFRGTFNYGNTKEIQQVSSTVSLYRNSQSTSEPCLIARGMMLNNFHGLKLYLNVMKVGGWMLNGYF